MEKSPALMTEITVTHASGVEIWEWPVPVAMSAQKLARWISAEMGGESTAKILAEMHDGAIVARLHGGQIVIITRRLL